MSVTGVLLYLLLIITSFLVAMPAGIVWLRIRDLTELKYFSSLALGTLIAHLLEGIGLSLILVFQSRASATWALLFIIPAALIKTGLWGAVALYVLGIINGIHPSTLRKNDTTNH